MRLLIITNYYPPHYKGGYELACRDTCEFLASRGHEVFILTGCFGIEKPDENSNFLPLQPVRRLKYIDYSSGSYLDKLDVEKHNYLSTLKAIDEVKPDIAYIWSMQAVSLSPVWAVQKRRLRRIFEIGDLWAGIYIDEHWKTKLKAIIKSILPFTLSYKTDISPIIAVSDWIGMEMKEKYGSKRVYVVPNGIKPPKKIKQNRNTEITKYIFTGRIDPQKGIHTAIEAFGKLVKEDKISNFYFDIYGDGDNEYLKSCICLAEKNSISEFVNFKGRIEGVSDIYYNYDIMLMPTMMREPFGMVTVEAMAAGLPVIATNKYGPAEIIDDGIDGLLFEPGSSEQLAEKIALLHNNNNLYEKLRRCAREKYLRNYQLEDIKAKVENILLSEIAEQKQ